MAPPRKYPLRPVLRAASRIPYVNALTWQGTNDTQREILIEQRVTNDAKSPLVAYLLLIFLWGLGVHRMYLGRWISGILMAVLWGLGWLTAPILIGWPILGLVCLWVIIDMFLIPGMIQDDKDDIRRRLGSELW
ncbi:MAG: TM2 domain-containing protein [Paracoccus sp. (in: a-proteobacteria)]